MSLSTRRRTAPAGGMDKERRRVQEPVALPRAGWVVIWDLELDRLRTNLGKGARRASHKLIGAAELVGAEEGLEIPGAEM
jgi:hypothetical protein